MKLEKNKSIEKINKSKSWFCGGKNDSCDMSGLFPVKPEPKLVLQLFLKISEIPQWPPRIPAFYPKFCPLQIKKVLPQISRLGLWQYKYH